MKNYYSKTIKYIEISCELRRNNVSFEDVQLMMGSNDVEMLSSVNRSIQLVRRPRLGEEPMFWPPRIIDLTAIDFLLGYIKTNVYGVNIPDLRHVGVRIRAAVATAIPDMIQRVTARMNTLSIPAERRLERISKHKFHTVLSK
jgi:hypothetical protein